MLAAAALLHFLVRWSPCSGKPYGRAEKRGQSESLRQPIGALLIYEAEDDELGVKV